MILDFTPSLSYPFPLSLTLGVSCGHNYTYAWTVDSGHLYTWGSGHCGVLGHGSEETLLKPRLVEDMQNNKVVSVGAGHSHCGVVTDCGLLYMTGLATFTFLSSIHTIMSQKSQKPKGPILDDRLNEKLLKPGKGCTLYSHVSVCLSIC